jgi:DNA repair photolyase
VVEPGTPPAGRIFAAVKKFTDAGVCCGVNVDPIMPLVTDSDWELDAVADACKAAGLHHMFGAMLRLRTDIWERMKIVLKLLEIPGGVETYKRIYNFQEPLNSSYVAANREYAEKILNGFEQKITGRGMLCDFPDYMGPQRIDKSCLGQTNLLSYLT